MGDRIVYTSCTIHLRQRDLVREHNLILFKVWGANVGEREREIERERERGGEGGKEGGRERERERERERDVVIQYHESIKNFCIPIFKQLLPQ